jgi:hypothetical protein
MTTMRVNDEHHLDCGAATAGREASRRGTLGHELNSFPAMPRYVRRRNSRTKPEFRIMLPSAVTRVAEVSRQENFKQESRRRGPDAARHS